jgi:hypothetical protein
MKKKIVKFLRPPGKFRLAYFVGQVAEMNEKQADELIEAGIVMPVETVNALPQDLPSRKVFAELGYSWEDIAQIKDFSEIKGISKAQAEKLVLYVENHKNK